MNNIVVYAARSADRGTTELSRTFEGRVEIDTLLLNGLGQEQFLNDLDNVRATGFSPEDKKKKNKCVLNIILITTTKGHNAC